MKSISRVVGDKTFFLPLPGAHSEAVWCDAESDRLRHPGRGHDHRPAAQQQKTAGETHHQDRGGDVRQPGPQEPRTQVQKGPEVVDHYHANVGLWFL